MTTTRLDQGSLLAPGVKSLAMGASSLRMLFFLCLCRIIRGGRAAHARCLTQRLFEDTCLLLPRAYPRATRWGLT